MARSARRSRRCHNPRKKMTVPKVLGILIAILIAAIAAAIILPCMMSPGIGSDESSAVASIRAISQMEVAYRVIYGGYANSLANLGGAEPCIKSAATACLLDQSLSNGVKAGYRFVATGSNPVEGLNSNYFVGAAPVTFGRTGKRRFCSTDKIMIRADLNASGSTVPPDGARCAEFSAPQ
jgi:hypothetical protein